MLRRNGGWRRKLKGRIKQVQHPVPRTYVSLGRLKVHGRSNSVAA